MGAWLSVLLASVSVVLSDPLDGWRKTDRFGGIRFEIEGKVIGVKFEETTQQWADRLACFGWVQPTKAGTVVGEARCNKQAIEIFKKFIAQGPVGAQVSKTNIHTYPDTKIKFHFSDFRILSVSEETCFGESPHKCLSSVDS